MGGLYQLRGISLDVTPDIINSEVEKLHGEQSPGVVSHDRH